MEIGLFSEDEKTLHHVTSNKEGVWISPTSLSNQSLIDWPDIGIFWLKQKRSPGRLRDFVIEQYLCWDKVCIEREEIMKRI